MHTMGIHVSTTFPTPHATFNHLRLSTKHSPRSIYLPLGEVLDRFGLVDEARLLEKVCVSERVQLDHVLFHQLLLVGDARGVCERAEMLPVHLSLTAVSRKTRSTMLPFSSPSLRTISIASARRRGLAQNLLLPFLNWQPARRESSVESQPDLRLLSPFCAPTAAVKALSIKQ